MVVDCAVEVRLDQFGDGTEWVVEFSEFQYFPPRLRFSLSSGQPVFDQIHEHRTEPLDREPGADSIAVGDFDLVGVLGGADHVVEGEIPAKVLQADFRGEPKDRAEAANEGKPIAEMGDFLEVFFGLKFRVAVDGFVGRKTGGGGGLDEKGVAPEHSEAGRPLCVNELSIIGGVGTGADAGEAGEVDDNVRVPKAIVVEETFRGTENEISGADEANVGRGRVLTVDSQNIIAVLLQVPEKIGAQIAAMPGEKNFHP